MSVKLTNHYYDHLGSKIASESFDEYGTKIAQESFTYDIWGNVLQGDKSKASFTGKRMDSTGLYYFNARYYDPKLRQFITEDPARQGEGWYNYCSNDPINRIDPDGQADFRVFTSDYIQELISNLKTGNPAGISLLKNGLFEGNQALAESAFQMLKNNIPTLENIAQIEKSTRKGVIRPLKDSIIRSEYFENFREKGWVAQDFADGKIAVNAVQYSSRNSIRVLDESSIHGKSFIINDWHAFNVENGSNLAIPVWKKMNPTEGQNLGIRGIMNANARSVHLIAPDEIANTIFVKGLDKSLKPFGLKTSDHSFWLDSNKNNMAPLNMSMKISPLVNSFSFLGSIADVLSFGSLMQEINKPGGLDRLLSPDNYGPDGEMRL